MHISNSMPTFSPIVRSTQRKKRNGQRANDALSGCETRESTNIRAARAELMQIGRV